MCLHVFFYFCLATTPRLPLQPLQEDRHNPDPVREPLEVVRCKGTRLSTVTHMETDAFAKRMRRASEREGYLTGWEG